MSSVSSIFAWLRTVWGGQDDQILYPRRVDVSDSRIFTKTKCIWAGLVVLLAASAAWMLKPSDPSISPYQAPWLNLTTSMQKLKLEPEYQTPMADINVAINFLTRAQYNLAIIIQDNILGGIARAEAKADSCREKRKLATAIVETASKVREFSSSLGEVQTLVIRLKDVVRNAAYRQSRSFKTFLHDLGIAGQLTERGHALVVRAQDRVVAVKKAKEVLIYTHNFLYTVGNRIRVLQRRWAKLAEEGEYVRSQLAEGKPCLPSTRVDKLLDDARRLGLDFLDADALFRMQEETEATD